MKTHPYLTGAIASMPPASENFLREGEKEPSKEQATQDKEQVQEKEQAPQDKEQPTEGGGRRKRGTPSPETEAKYAEAVRLYTDTRLTCREICARCGLTERGLQAYLRRFHREKVLERHDVRCCPEEAHAIRLSRSRGQTPAAYLKYREAVLACDDLRFIDYTVSAIARIFGLNETGLNNQLRKHYPDIARRRQQERELRGMSDGGRPGVRPRSRELYAAAVEMLRTTELPLPEVARLCGVSPEGLSEHVLSYHRGLLRQRQALRKEGGAVKRKGRVMGNGRLHVPSPVVEERYREAVELYRTTALSLKEIAAATCVTAGGLRAYLHTWHKELVFARRGAAYTEGDTTRLSDTKAYRPATAAKYAEAIACLKEHDRSAAAVAAEFGLHPESFRDYLKEHEPELYASRGMSVAANGKRVSARSMQRYAEAIRLFETTAEDLKSIATRLGIPYNSIGSFIRRNMPEVMEKHRQKCAMCE